MAGKRTASLARRRGGGPAPPVATTSPTQDPAADSPSAHPPQPPSTSSPHASPSPEPPSEQPPPPNVDIDGNDNDGNDNSNDSDSVAMLEGRTFFGASFTFPPRAPSSSWTRLPRSLDPSCPHTPSEWLAAALIAAQVALWLSGLCHRSLFLALFVFWRLAYNVGIGAILHAQSTASWFVRLVKRAGLGSAPRIPRSDWAAWAVDRLVVSRMERDTDFVHNYDAMPSEFNAWILFQELCDLVFANDIASYIFLSTRDMVILGGGSLLVAFNLWVKSDAYELLKDFSWYWGDFFFLMDDAETPDLGFETVPHPMYSIGYIGYYGVALITQSYTVLFVSLAAHICQALFLASGREAALGQTLRRSRASHRRVCCAEPVVIQKFFSRDPDRAAQPRPVPLHGRADAVCVSVHGPHGRAGRPIADEAWRFWFFVGQALVWRVLHTYVLGLILYLQSKHKFWSRHFIRHGRRPARGVPELESLHIARLALTHAMVCRLYNLSVTMTLYQTPPSFIQ
ncbi:hypothetical protein BC831DRAFT_521762, partial [Entophlyctis helioformis]